MTTPDSGWAGEQDRSRWLKAQAMDPVSAFLQRKQQEVSQQEVSKQEVSKQVVSQQALVRR